MDKDEKKFTAIGENGGCYSFMLNADATEHDAELFAQIWNLMSGSDERISKAWERG